MSRLVPDLQRYVERRMDWVVRARETGEDLVQSCCRELLERVQEGRFQFQGEGQFRQWLYEAALLKLRDRERHWRAAKRDVRRQVVAEGDVRRWSEAYAHSTATPSRTLVKAEDLSLLQAAFARLSAQDQELLIMAHVEGLTHAEIALRLGITASHSRVRLSRVLARLARAADELKQRGEDSR